MFDLEKSDVLFKVTCVMPPSKWLGGLEALTCLYVNFPFVRNKSVQETALRSL